MVQVRFSKQRTRANWALDLEAHLREQNNDSGIHIFRVHRLTRFRIAAVTRMSTNAVFQKWRTARVSR